MEYKNTSIYKHLFFFLWQVFCFSTALICMYIILINRQPNYLRPISMASRTGFGLIVPIAAVVAYLVFRIHGKAGYLLGMVFTVSLFTLPLAGLWASGQTQSTVLSGIIPLYDAESYYVDALGLIYGNKFSIFSARRPFFPGLLAVLLSWTGHNLMASLAILTAIVGFASYFAAKEIQRTHGAEVAIFVLIILFLFFRAHSGISMSENLGVALGVLGFTFLWHGASNKNILYLYFGIFTTTLALIARAGAFFILPILTLWIGWLLRGNKYIAWKPVIIASITILSGFFLNLILTRMIAIPSGVPFANFSYTLFGLASGGKSWAYVFDVHPEVLFIQEPEQSRRIYQLAFELIRTHPLQTVDGALFSWKMLFSNSWYNIYSYVGGENWTINVFARWGMYLLCLTGVYAWFKDRKDPIKSLVLASFLGVLISVPFLPPTDAYRMRPYAASIIILIALPALGLGFIFNKTKVHFLVESTEVVNPLLTSLIFTTILIITITIGPIILSAQSSQISLQPAYCKDENSEFILIHFDQGTFINIKKQNLPFLDWMPNYHVGLFKKNAHSLADINLINWAESLQPPMTLFYSFDHYRKQKVLVAYKTEAPITTGRYYQFCGKFEISPSLISYRIFYPEEAISLSQ